MVLYGFWWRGLRVWLNCKLPKLTKHVIADYAGYADLKTAKGIYSHRELRGHRELAELFWPAWGVSCEYFFSKRASAENPLADTGCFAAFNPDYERHRDTQTKTRISTRRQEGRETSG